MVFQIKRVDVAEPSRILEVGKHTIGPGQYLLREESNLEVPTDHAQLLVTDDIVSLKTLDKNPCYYIKTKTDKKEILRQNDIYTFKSGDRFGLTPDSFWYEITTCCGLDTTPNPLKLRNSNRKDGHGIESGDQNNVISVSDTEDDAVIFEMSESLEDFNKSAATLLKELEGSSSTQALPTTNKRVQDANDSSTTDIKKAKTEPSPQDMQGAQSGPKNEKDCVCCP
ncbi:unnamed protein product [Arctia plantaginis]|uniref:PNK FHA domain-containing protein n=1 Tax=Arctia plantaginis TaxID=874455 RepID=A0A8S0ZPC1_ARCPL|nr:unnamed protein product [Arctia plantaginis]CAB3235124.1 unnamed protein product [Arctia plantaginis]